MKVNRFVDQLIPPLRYQCYLLLILYETPLGLDIVIHMGYNKGS